jgi:large subunit ribosomal protein L35
MPKIKTNRQAAKKIKVTGKGRFKRAQAGTSHNTAKKSSERMRRLRGKQMLDTANERSVKSLLPYKGSHK